MRQVYQSSYFLFVSSIVYTFFSVCKVMTFIFCLCHKFLKTNVVVGMFQAMYPSSWAEHNYSRQTLVKGWIVASKTNKKTDFNLQYLCGFLCCSIPTTAVLNTVSTSAYGWNRSVIRCRERSGAAGASSCTSWSSTSTSRRSSFSWFSPAAWPSYEPTVLLSITIVVLYVHFDYKVR